MIRQKVREFQKEYGIENPTSKVLRSIIESQGYTVIEFNGVADSKEVQTLIQLLNIQKNIESSRCFVYQDERYRLLFILFMMISGRNLRRMNLLIMLLKVRKKDIGIRGLH